MGWLNVARVVFGLSPTVVSRYKDDGGWIWSRDQEGFYFRSKNFGRASRHGRDTVNIYTYRKHVMASDVPSCVRNALEPDGAGFEGDAVDGFVERWSYDLIDR